MCKRNPEIHSKEMKIGGFGSVICGKVSSSGVGFNVLPNTL